MTQQKPLTEAGGKIVGALRAFGGEASTGQVADQVGMPVHTVSCLAKGLPRVHRAKNHRGKPRDRMLYYDEPEPEAESSATVHATSLALRLPVIGPGSEWVLAL